ncbi:hypothetical protein N9830_01825, partial [Akkermansiaceae bacterium]|nr:hypothetical protein [Akkermansiaceae bacterium]MDC1349518.1 hypothetical protein [Akkermansiaceae bacterium]
HPSQVLNALRFARHLCFFVIVVLSGLDQAVVQSYAWITMIHDRAPELGVREAINDTFSGESPCEICCALAEVTEQEQEDAPLKKGGDQGPKLFAKFSSLQLFPPARDTWPRLTEFVALSSLHLEIPTPPPEFG